MNPMKFLREVRAELSKVTWPSRQETLVTTLMVLAFSTIASLFFMAAGWVIQTAFRFLFGFG